MSRSKIQLDLMDYMRPYAGLSRKFSAPDYFQSADWNALSFITYRNWIYSLAMSRFRWLNLPDSCDERYLEWVLLTKGQATIATPENLLDAGEPKFYSTDAAVSGMLSKYDNPVKWQSIGNNGWLFNVTDYNGVFIYDNRLRVPIVAQLDLFARRLSAFDRTIDINLFAQKTPWLVTADQSQQETVQNLVSKATGGEPVIIGTDQLRDVDIKSINVQVPYIGEQLEFGKQHIWNSIYTFLGIDSLPRKSERMIEDEVLANNEPSALRALDPLSCRREAADTLNKRFGLDIEVVWNRDNETDNFNYEENVTIRESEGE